MCLPGRAKFCGLVSNCANDTVTYSRPDKLFNVSAASISSIDMPESTLVPRLVRSMSPFVISVSNEPRSDDIGGPLGVSGNAGGAP